MPPWVYGGVQLEGASLLYIRWEENGGRGKPLPYCLGRGAPWGSRRDSHRER